MNSKTLTLLASLAFATAGVPALAAPGDTVGTITHLSGLLSVTRADGSMKLLSLQSQLMEGDVLTTTGDAFARMKFVDQSELVLRPESVLKIAEFTYREAEPARDRMRIELVSGGFRAVTGALAKRSREAASYDTPRGTIKPMGTHLGALFCQNDCGGVPTPTGKTPDNGLHVDVASGAVVVTPKLTITLPTSGSGSGPAAPGMPPNQTGASKDTGGTQSNAPGSQIPNPAQPNPTAGPTGGVTPPIPGGTGAPPTNPTAGSPVPVPATVLNAGQFGYLPPPQNGVQPPLVLVPPSQAVQVRMPQSISQNNPQGSATSKTSDPECVVQ